MTEEPRDFPRVLVLCDEPINTISGGGVTMGNLFRGWPSDKLGQVWAHHRFAIDETVCPNYLRLGEHKMPGGSWAPDILRKQRGLVRSLRLLLRPGIRLDYARVLRWAKDFSPDVIYAQATPYPMYTWWLPRWLMGDLNVPLVHHIMDDWPTSLQAEWPLLFRWTLTPFLENQLSALFSAATFNLAICQQMVDAFSSRYGQHFIPFHNAIDLDNWTKPKHDYGIKGGVFKVVYLGALAIEMQLLSLREVARTISSLAERGVSINLTVFTGDIYVDYYRQYLGGLGAVSHGGAVERKDLCTRLTDADLLVIPVNFDSRSQMHNRYSMPTKVPEYMASGTPVLVYAPGNVPPAKYAREGEWGYVVDHQSPSLLEAALTDLMESETLRAHLGRRARELAVANHDARNVRARFCDMLSMAVSSA